MRFRRFFLYAAVGATGTLVQYCLLVSLVQLAGVGPLTASCIGAIAGAAVNYGLNYTLTFKSSADHRLAATRYFSVAAVGFCVNWGCMAFLVSGAEIAYLPAQCISTFAVLCLTYSGNAMWSFSARGHS